MAEEQSGQRRRIDFFYDKDGCEVDEQTMPREGFDDKILSALGRMTEAGVEEGLGDRTRIIFKESGDNGMSLVHCWFKSGFVLPFHSHSTDCLYYILGGELRMGSRVLRKGDGFFLPAEVGYGYEAGPEGVEVLEFRNASRFNFMFRSNPDSRWDKVIETYRERTEIWEQEVPPSER